MVSITLSVPDKTRKIMKLHDEVNWSGFVRKAIEQKAKEMETLETLQKQLMQESEIADFTVKLQKVSRAGRFEELKRKGLL